MLYYFLPAIILLGIITSYEDIKFGKIRNKWIVSALIYAVVVYTVLIIYYFFTTGIEGHYLWELLTNILFVSFLSFGMWYFGLWTAGDGKLFIAFSLLIPISMYKYGYQEWIPSVTLLMNIFILGLVFMLGMILCNSKLKNIKRVFSDFFKDFFKTKKLLNSVFSLFAIFWLVDIFFSLTGIEPNYILRVAVTLLLMLPLQKKTGEKFIYVMIAISVLRLFIDRTVFSLVFLKEFLILLFIWKFARSFIQECASGLGKELFSKEIYIKDLKPGMLLSDFIEKRGALTKAELEEIDNQKLEMVKTGGVYYIRRPKSSFKFDSFIDEEAEGLTKEDVRNIKKTGIKKIKVAQTIPFAPLIFVGVILTLMAKGNILIVIKNLF